MRPKNTSSCLRLKISPATALRDGFGFTLKPLLPVPPVEG